MLVAIAATEIEVSTDTAVAPPMIRSALTSPAFPTT
jgi:hypothetical protein